MATTIQDFKSIIIQERGLSKANRFECSIADSGENIKILCETTSLPGRQIMTGEYNSNYKALKYVYGYMTDDVTLTYHLTNNYTTKKFFEKWHYNIVNFDRYRSRYINEFSKNVTISQLDEQNKAVYTVTLIDAFPVTLNSIELSDNSVSTTNKLSVTLTYKDYRVDLINTGTSKSESLVASPSISPQTISKEEEIDNNKKDKILSIRNVSAYGIQATVVNRENPDGTIVTEVLTPFG